ncbi:MAG: hypothetical protein EOO88_62990, partial [Pedobacter sp.]
HWRYVLRYPPAFEKFLPVSDRNRSLMSKPPEDIIINEYDNSILYTDHVLHTIATMINNSGAKGTMLFVSDHGENINDDGGLYFHSYKPTPHTAHVPLFIYPTDNFAAKYPQLISNMRANAGKKISSAESVFYTMTDLAGLILNGDDSTKKLTSPALLPSKQQILGDNGKVYNYADLK